MHNATNGAWSKTFPSVIGDAMIKNDGTFQHLAADSIFAVFRNPNLPLDTLRLAIPFVASNQTGILAPIHSGSKKVSIQRTRNALLIRGHEAIALHVTLTDTRGRMLYTAEYYQGDGCRVAMNNTAPGAYIVQVKSSDGQQLTQRIVWGSQPGN
jgi:hypothetical protein